MGRPKKIIPPNTILCLHCGKEKNTPEYMANVIKKEPVCYECLSSIYNNYLNFYKKQMSNNAKKAAIKRICMIMDWYFDESLFDSVSAKHQGIIFSYIKALEKKNLLQKGYDEAVMESVLDSIEVDIEPKVTLRYVHSRVAVGKVRAVVSGQDMIETEEAIK